MRGGSRGGELRLDPSGLAYLDAVSRNQRPTRERLWIYFVVMLGCVGGFVLHAATLEEDAGAIVVREDGARALLLRVVEAQRRHHEETGRFGTLPELIDAGELEDEAPYTGSDGVTVLRADGYRVDVLLPERRSADAQVLLVIGTEGELSADMRKKHYAVVARPFEPAVTGFRTLYADESGSVFVSEGVSDEPSRTTNPLPRVHLSSGTPRSPLGLVWMRWEDVEARWQGK